MIMTNLIATKEDFEKREKERRNPISSILSGEKLYPEDELRNMIISNDYNHISFYSDTIYYISQIDITKECEADWGAIDNCNKVNEINDNIFKSISDYGKNVETNFFNLLQYLDFLQKDDILSFCVFREIACENKCFSMVYFILFPEEEEKIIKILSGFLPKVVC